MVTDFSIPLYNSSYDRVRIYAHRLSGAKYQVYSGHFKGNFDGVYKFSPGVHRSFGYPPIQVCVAGILNGANLGRNPLGPLCRSVG